MTDVDDADLDDADLDTPEPTDGRVARRQRNIDAVLDVVLEMFTEDAMFPTIEQAATRSGLSLRSLYRYFADPAELREAAIKRSAEVAQGLSRLHAIGQGPLEDRIKDFVGMRLRLFDSVGPRFRASTANAARHERIRELLTRDRNDMRNQFELQFAPELDQLEPREREDVVAAGDLMTQLDALDFLQRHRGLSPEATARVLTGALRSLFG